MQVGFSAESYNSPALEQEWQPLGDGRWDRVVEREGVERSVGRSH